MFSSYVNSIMKRKLNEWQNLFDSPYVQGHPRNNVDTRLPSWNDSRSLSSRRKRKSCISPQSWWTSTWWRTVCTGLARSSPDTCQETSSSWLWTSPSRSIDRSPMNLLGWSRRTRRERLPKRGSSRSIFSGRSSLFPCWKMNQRFLCFVLKFPSRIFGYYSRRFFFFLSFFLNKENVALFYVHRIVKIIRKM